MAVKNKREFILLSELVSKLENNEYYLTYAKSLALTENITNSTLHENELINEMFNYFISINELPIYRDDKNERADKHSQHDNSASVDVENFHLIEEPKITDLQYDEIFVRIKDLKKLYANKCIVFPSSLLK